MYDAGMSAFAGRPPEVRMEHSRTRSNRNSLAFGREHRILKRSDFVKIYGAGRKAYGRHIILFGLRRPPAELVPVTEITDSGRNPWRLGVTATRKSGNSAQRNRQRRRIREFFRLHQRALPEGWDFVVNTRASLNDASHHELSTDLVAALLRFGIRLDIGTGD